MDVLHITGEFPPYFSGGLATYVSEVVNRLEKYHTVDVVLIKGDDEHYQTVPPAESSNNLTITNLDVGAIEDVQTSVLDEMTIRNTVGTLPEREYDVIHVHDWYGVLGALAMPKNDDTPIVMMSHLPLRSGFTYSSHPIPERLKRHLEALGFRIATRVLAPSEFIGQVLQREYDVASEKLSIVPNGVDTARFTPKGSMSDNDSTGVNVTTVSRLTEQKGYAHLLDATASLSDRLSIDVNIFGEGPHRPHLESQSSELGIDEVVTFHGFVSNASLLSAYRKADVFAFPTVYEPFGLVVLEAMAVGTPIVAFDAGGVKEIVRDGTDGLLVPPGDTDAFANALTKLATNPERRAKMSRQARTRAVAFDWDQTVSTLESTYQNLTQLVST